MGADTLASKACPKHVGDARLVAAYLFTKYTPFPLKDIGYMIGRENYFQWQPKIRRMNEIMKTDEEHPLKTAILSIFDTLKSD